MDRYGVVVMPLPEKIAKAVAKVLYSRYNREEMRRYAFEKFGGGNVEKFPPSCSL